LSSPTVAGSADAGGSLDSSCIAVRGAARASSMETSPVPLEAGSGAGGAAAGSGADGASLPLNSSSKEIVMVSPVGSGAGAGGASSTDSSGLSELGAETNVGSASSAAAGSDGSACEPKISSRFTSPEDGVLPDGGVR